MIDILQWVLMFFIYAFLGWCVEVAFAAVKNGQFVNRGFLNGSVCPIYGFGVVGVILVLMPFENNLPILFIGSALLTTLIEFVTGFVLEKLFHTKWWDYSDMPLNIKGYICPLFSLMWGAACVVVVKCVHPPIAKAVDLLPVWLLWGIDGVCVVNIALDFAATVVTIRKLQARLKLLTNVSTEINALSDELAKGIYGGTVFAMKQANKVKGDIELKKTEFEQKASALSARFDTLANGTLSKAEARLLKAFPHMKDKLHNEKIEALREKIEKLVHKK